MPKLPSFGGLRFRSLVDIPLEPKMPMIGGGIIHPDAEVTILYGHGNGGKGLVACATIRTFVAEEKTVLILDFERHSQEWTERLPGIDNSVYYLDPVDDIFTIAKYVDEFIEAYGVNVLIIDSASRCAPDPMRGQTDSHVARRTVARLCAFGIPTLLIAHVPKRKEDVEPVHVPNPIGSVQWTDQARCTWSLIPLPAADGFSRMEVKCFKLNDREQPKSRVYIWDHETQTFEVEIDDGFRRREFNLTREMWNIMEAQKPKLWTAAPLAIELQARFPLYARQCTVKSVEGTLRRRMHDRFRHVRGGWSSRAADSFSL